MTHQLLHDNMGFGANVLSVFQARRGSSVAWVKTPAKWVQYFAGVWAGRQLFHEIYDWNPRSCQTSPWSQAALHPKHSTEEGEACSKESSFHKKREKAFRSPPCVWTRGHPASSAPRPCQRCVLCAPHTSCRHSAQGTVRSEGSQTHRSRACIWTRPLWAGGGHLIM